MIHWLNVVLMLGQRLRRWPNIKTTLISCSLLSLLHCGSWMTRDVGGGGRGQGAPNPSSLGCGTSRGQPANRGTRMNERGVVGWHTDRHYRNPDEWAGSGWLTCWPSITGVKARSPVVYDSFRGSNIKSRPETINLPSLNWPWLDHRARNTRT